MISREDYLNALELIDLYHYQLQLQPAKTERIEIEKNNIERKNYISIDEADLSPRCYNALKCHEINYLNEVAEYTRMEIHKVPKLGHRSICELDDKLPEYGLSWRT